jgi:hypothetical protein
MNFTSIFYVFFLSHKSTKFVFVLDSWKCHSGRRHPILQELYGYNQPHAQGMEQNMVLLAEQVVCT